MSELKILHLADLHLGCGAYERWRDGRPVRLYESLAALDAVLDAGLRENAHAVVVAGDVYDHPKPEPIVAREWARRVARLRNAGVPLVVVPGNHDRPGRAPGVSGLAVFDALDLPGVTVAAEAGVYDIPTPAGSLTTVAIPWVFGGPRENVDRAEAEIQESLAGAWDARLADARFAILVGHLWARGGRASSERGFFGEQAAVALTSFAHPGIKYYALGHLHLHQKIAMPAGGPAAYAGAPVRFDFSDEGVPKGAVLATLADDGPTQWRFLEIPAREFVTVTVEARDEDAARRALAAAAAGRDWTEAIVRLKLVNGVAALEGFGVAEVREAFADAFALRIIVETTPAAARRREGISAESGLAGALAAFVRDNPPPSNVSLDDLINRARELEAAPPPA
jgi:exonuclease SbcD